MDSVGVQSLDSQRSAPLPERVGSGYSLKPPECRQCATSAIAKVWACALVDVNIELLGDDVGPRHSLNRSGRTMFEQRSEPLPTVRWGAVVAVAVVVGVVVAVAEKESSHAVRALSPFASLG